MGVSDRSRSERLSTCSKRPAGLDSTMPLQRLSLPMVEDEHRMQLVRDSALLDYPVAGRDQLCDLGAESRATPRLIARLKERSGSRLHPRPTVAFTGLETRLRAA